jgi:hypothetical protein
LSDIRFKFFAEHTHTELERSVNDFLNHENIHYIDHDFIADGLEKPYNMSLVYIKRRVGDRWRKRVFGGGNDGRA